jgi:cell division transport system ATP-binding protein
MIQTINVSLSYGNGVQALRNVSVRIGSGEFVFIIGSTGSGKSTFLKLLNREEMPTSGQVLVAGKDVVRMRPRQVPFLRRNVGVVFQDFRLLRDRTVAQNVAFALEVINKPQRTIKRVVPEVLEMVGLEGKANRLPGELSGGEQQRVAIARAFVNRPLVLLADEPTGNLDSQNGAQVMELLGELHAGGATIVMVTHDPRYLAQVRRTVHLFDGRLASRGSLNLEVA